MLPDEVATHIAASARPGHGRGGSGVQAAGGEAVPRGERPDGGHLSGLRDLRADPAGVDPAVPPGGRRGPGEPFPEAPPPPPADAAAGGGPHPPDEAEAPDLGREADPRLPPARGSGGPLDHRPPRPEAERADGPGPEEAETLPPVPAAPRRLAVADGRLRVPDPRGGEGLRLHDPRRPVAVPRHGAGLPEAQGPGGGERPPVGPPEREAAEGGLRGQRPLLPREGLQGLLHGADDPRDLRAAVQPEGAGEAGAFPRDAVPGADLPSRLPFPGALPPGPLVVPEEVQQSPPPRWHRVEDADGGLPRQKAHEAEAHSSRIAARSVATSSGKMSCYPTSTYCNVLFPPAGTTSCIRIAPWVESFPCRRVQLYSLHGRTVPY